MAKAKNEKLSTLSVLFGATTPTVEIQRFSKDIKHVQERLDAKDFRVTDKSELRRNKDDAIRRASFSFRVAPQGELILPRHV